MGGWVVGWVRVFLISRSVRSRMFPAWPRMLPSCAPQVPPMSLVCRPQVLRMFLHVPCERFACSLLHPHVLPYVPACSRVFPACSPHDLCILHACSPHVPCMFPACARVFPACSQHVPRMFPACSLYVSGARHFLGQLCALKEMARPSFHHVSPWPIRVPVMRLFALACACHHVPVMCHHVPVMLHACPRHVLLRPCMCESCARHVPSCARHVPSCVSVQT